MANDELKHRAGIRALFDDIAKECRWAVDDIRQEVVERPWFGQEVTPERVDVGEWNDVEQAQLSARDYRESTENAIERNDLYGSEPEPDDMKERDMER